MTGKLKFDQQNFPVTHFPVRNRFRFQYPSTSTAACCTNRAENQFVRGMFVKGMKNKPFL